MGQELDDLRIDSDRMKKGIKHLEQECESLTAENERLKKVLATLRDDFLLRLSTDELLHREINWLRAFYKTAKAALNNIGGIKEDES